VKATKRQKPEPWDPTRLSFRTVRETSDRIRALAKKEGMTVTSLIAEAIYIHLHRLESRGDRKRRRMLVCGACGKPAVDAATDGRKKSRQP